MTGNIEKLLEEAKETLREYELLLLKDMKEKAKKQTTYETHRNFLMQSQIEFREDPYRTLMLNSIINLEAVRPSPKVIIIK